MGDYFNALLLEDTEVANRYKEKISVIHNIDPFALDEKGFSSDPAKFPPLTNMDIVTYFVLTTSYYTKQQMKAYKSLNAFKYFEAGFVTSCGAQQIGDFTVIIGKIKHSQRINLPPLRTWVICQTEDDSVNTAHCTCMAGLGEVCSHVGALLYAVQYIVSSHSSISCTDLRATWNVPSVSKVECKPIKEISFGRIINLCGNPNVKPLTQYEIENILRDIEEVGSTSALMKIVEPFATKLATELEKHSTGVENPFQGLFNEQYEACTLEELISIASTIDVSISEEDCEIIKKVTATQTCSDEWFLQRVGRVTASNFKRAVRTSTTKPSLSVVKAICYPLNFHFKTKATEWGKNQEKNALEGYKHEQNLYHENLQLKTVGLCINFQMPYFGASPDGMVSCSCCGEGCVEIKCPYLLKDISLEEYCNTKGSCLRITEDGIYLNQNHSYFYQVQQQMAVTKTNYCDFVVWSPQVIFIQRIAYNEDFWASESQKSLKFHKNVIMPELLAKYFSTNRDVALYCLCQSIDDGRPMICCGNDNCSIFWYHLDCQGLEEVPQSLWYCPNCI